jgi:hypothetical protein
MQLPLLTNGERVSNYHRVTGALPIPHVSSCALQPPIQVYKSATFLAGIILSLLGVASCYEDRPPAIPFQRLCALRERCCYSSRTFRFQQRVSLRLHISFDLFTFRIAVIAQMFEWTWDSIAAECTDFLGPSGLYPPVSLAIRISDIPPP